MHDALPVAGDLSLKKFFCASYKAEMRSLLPHKYCAKTKPKINKFNLRETSVTLDRPLA
jgi:hypothetical protein